MTISSTDVVAKDIKFCVLDLDKRNGSYTISNMNHPYYPCDPDEDFVIDKNYKIKGYYEYLISKISMPTGTMSVRSLVTLPDEITIQQKIDLEVRKYRNKMRQELCDQGKITFGCKKKIVAKVEETKSKVTKSKKVKAKAKVTKVAKNYNTNSYKGKSINFTIKDKKEQCEEIGFKPQTEKFADCVLRLVELDVKQQQSNKIAQAQQSGNDALVKQLQRQQYDRGTDALLNLGQQLLNPGTTNSNIYMPQTQRCTIQGFGTFANMVCR